jgi:prepilin-type N-terminal cleavage/methylation domain-containing protein
MKRESGVPSVSEGRGEQGFTLIEALIAIAILAIGLAGVTNLFVVASASNTAANHATAAATEAVETMERLKAIPFLQLVPGGSLTADLPATNTTDAVTNLTYNRVRDVDGVGRIRSRWTIGPPGAGPGGPGPGGPDIYFITVRAESLSPMMMQRTRADLTTFRACTTGNCP